MSFSSRIIGAINCLDFAKGGQICLILFEFGGNIVWEPTADYLEDANLTRFMEQHGIEDFDELMRRSTEDVAWFTHAVLNFIDVQFYEPYTQVVDLSQGIQFPDWCVGGVMNIVHNCVDKYQRTDLRDQPAVIWEGEEGGTKTLTYRELYEQVNKAANALRSLGLGKRDAVGLYMPMTPEIVVAMLAVAKIGGIILPLFSGYGAGAVVTRLADADAKASLPRTGSSGAGNPSP